MHSNLGKLIYLKRSQISQVWLRTLGQHLDEPVEAKLKLVRNNRKKKKDLFTLLIKILNKETKLDEEQLYPILQKIRTPVYSISDFYTESSCLESSINEHLKLAGKLTHTECFKGMELIRYCLKNIFARVLHETSEYYEQVLESKTSGFVQTDKNGKIVFANQAMTHITGYKALIGRNLEDFFQSDDKAFIHKLISKGSREMPITGRFEIKTAGGGSVTVGLEIGPLNIGEKFRGGYANFTNISRAMEVVNQVFDKAPLGVLKTNRKGKIIYANPSMMYMCGMDNWQGKKLRDIAPDKKNYEKVSKGLEKRLKGISGEYNIEITRIDDKKRIPVRISAFPETDLDGKKVIGSFAIIQNLTRDRMHRHIETIRNVEELLTAVAVETRLLVPFDLFYVSEYSTDLQHVRPIFNYPPRDEPISQRRWWEMTPARMRWANQKKMIVVEDLEEFFNRKEWKGLKDDALIQSFLQEGFKSFMFYPILRDQKIIASISLMSKSDNPYLGIHQKLLKSLPLYTAVQMALYHHKRKELDFTLALISQISTASNDMYKMTDVIVNQLAQHFKWNNVAIYRADPDSGHFFLRSQATTSKEYCISPKTKRSRSMQGCLDGFTATMKESTSKMFLSAIVLKTYLNRLLKIHAPSFACLLNSVRSVGC
jgi:PAS domain S-box-containing protein